LILRLAVGDMKQGQTTFDQLGIFGVSGDDV
jgi:hypothetical protein